GRAPASQRTTTSPKAPATPADAGRMDRAELTAGLSPLDQLVTANVTGSAELHLPIKAPFLGINSNIASAANTIIVDLPDFTDLKTALVHIPDAIADVGKFSRIDAASFVSLMGQFTGWLGQFRRSDTFAKFDVPLLGSALDQVLKFNAAFRDAILIDQGANDQIDGDDQLATDLNKALKDAGLDGKLHAEIAGGKVRLIA